MAGIGVVPGYVSAVNAYRAKKAGKPTSFGAALGTTPATKAALLPSLEGGLGLPGVPKVAPPKSLVPQVNIPQATPPATVPPLSGLDAYKKELTDDEAWGIAQKQYENSLAMGERSLFGDPFRQMLTQYGYVPSEAQIGALSPELQAMVRKYLDPAAVKAAQENPYSTAATIKHGFDKALATVPVEYAERGLLNAEGKLSGGAAIAASTLERARGQQAAQTMDEFLKGVGGANANWLNYQNQQTETLRQAREQIATRLAQEAGYRALLDAQGNEDAAARAAEAAGYDYSGGPSAIYQPAPDVGAILDRNAVSGRNDSWAAAMQRAINAANKPKKKKGK